MNWDPGKVIVDFVALSATTKLTTLASGLGNLSENSLFNTICIFCISPNDRCARIDKFKCDV